MDENFSNKQTNKQATPSEQFQDLSEKLQKTSKMEALENGSRQEITRLD
jgi:hypothetical protein